jgi:hypothetical protein
MHVASWRFDLHCGIEQTGSFGIVYIVCHQVRCHLSEYETSSLGNHLLAKAHIAKLNKFTEFEVAQLTISKVGETALH